MLRNNAGLGRTPGLGDTAKHVAVVGLSHPFRGGISHYSTLFVRTLRQEHRVSFITLNRQYPSLLFPGKTQLDTSASAIHEPNEALIDSINPLSWLRAAARLNELNPDLIVFQWWHPFFAPAYGSIVRRLSPALRERVCYLCHNVIPHESGPLLGALTRYAFSRSRFFVVHSSADAENLLRLRPDATVLKASHPTYAEFGAAQPGSRTDARRELGLADDAKTLLFFGLVRPYKGLRHLIEAMAILAPRMDCRLLVVGEFYEPRQPYLDQVAKLGLQDRVRIVDQYVPNEEVGRYFAAANVVVLPYETATQSGIVQIAFGLGRPVISTNVGGLPEAVEHGKTGLLVDPQDPPALAEAIASYFGRGLEPAFAAEIERQRERFDWSQSLVLVNQMLADTGRC